MRLRPLSCLEALVGPTGRTLEHQPRAKRGNRQVKFWDRIETVGEQHSVLRHPFYVRWSEGTLTALYAIESAQPAISTTKQDGLARHYGIPGARYFELHRSRDLEHSAEIRELIDRRLAGADEDSLVSAAESVLEANWLLLDG